MEKRLTSYCMQVHAFIQSHANERHPIDDEVIDTWVNLLFSREVVDGWAGHGDEYPGKAVQ